MSAYIFGKTVRKNQWNAGDIDKLGLAAGKRLPAMRQVPVEYILDTLHATGRLYADKNSLWYKRAFRQVAAASGFSRETVEISLSLLPKLLDKSEMSRRLRLELFLPNALDACISRAGYDGLVTAAPRGVALHIGAGNVFLGILDSLVMGMLTRNVNIVKTASGGVESAVHFAQALKTCDKTGVLSSSIAVLNWPGGSADVEEAIARHADAIVVWGGGEAVRGWRKAAPASAHVIGFGPKTSFAVIMPSAMKSRGADALAMQAARQASLWEQSACASPHCVYIVSPELHERDPLAKDFVRALARAFAQLAGELPPAKLSVDEQVEITKARELAKIDMAVNAAYVESAFPKTDWTVISEKSPKFSVSPQNRTLYVKCVSSLDEIEKQTAAMRGLIQTAGVAGTLAEKTGIARRLVPLGVARITDIGAMLEAPAGSPHDGVFPMRELVRFAGIEGLPSALDKLSAIVEYARANSPFYKRHFAGSGRIESLEDFRKLPFLLKEDILANTPPENSGMFTGPATGGIFFASGGSTGNPKYIFYNGREYDRVSRALAQCFMRGGLCESDRAANLFVSGNLWSSWISVEKALAKTPAVSVPIGSALPVEEIARYLHEFQVTAVLGLPSFLLKLAQYCATLPKARRFPLRLVFYGGEYAGKEAAQYFNSVFPGAIMRSAGYATVDTGVVGWQCPHCAGSIHHLCEDEQFMEIIDPQTAIPLPQPRPCETADEAAIGEIVLTVLNKKHMPVIRFRAGDLARWTGGTCACGSAARRFELLGRCDDRIHAGGAHIFVNDLSTAVSALPELSLNFQLEISKRGPQDRLKLRAELKEGQPPPPDAEKKLLQSIHRNCKDLAYSLEQGWMEPPEIEILPAGKIPRIERTGKIRKVIDQR
ncbi:MAG: acyl-CoA reductase [Elusimicrobiales bacterium]